MTKLLDEAFDRLRQLPEPMQDQAARALIAQMEEESEPIDRDAVKAGRCDLKNGHMVTLDEFAHEMGIGDR